eukprot:scaffold60651_cov21-Tisochrysis_lutea.AAC.3
MQESAGKGALPSPWPFQLKVANTADQAGDAICPILSTHSLCYLSLPTDKLLKCCPRFLTSLARPLSQRVYLQAKAEQQPAPLPTSSSMRSTRPSSHQRSRLGTPPLPASRMGTPPAPSSRLGTPQDLPRMLSPAFYAATPCTLPTAPSGFTPPPSARLPGSLRPSFSSGFGFGSRPNSRPSSQQPYEL